MFICVSTEIMSLLPSCAFRGDIVWSCFSVLVGAISARVGDLDRTGNDIPVSELPRDAADEERCRRGAHGVWPDRGKDFQ